MKAGEAAIRQQQLRGAEGRYSAQELEGLALFEAIRHFSFYLYSGHFTMVTDHKGLTNMMSRPQQNRRLLS